MVDEIPTGLTCTVTGDTDTTCTAAGPVGVIPGRVNVQSDPNSNPDSQSADWTATFTIPASGNPIQ